MPFMQAVATTPGLLALFSGHDHGNSWCYKWDGKLPGMTVDGRGLNICFGQRSGYGGYGDWSRGARQIFVTEAMLEHEELDTWVRLENRDIVASVTLNSTCGQDRYPVVVSKERHTYSPIRIIS